MADCTQVSDACSGTLSGLSANLFLQLITALTQSKCELGSIDQYPDDLGNGVHDQEFDFIVVGAGAAGSVVANRLTENPDWRVLVLEAGNYPSPTSEVPGLKDSLVGSKEDWSLKTEPSETCCRSLKNRRSRLSFGRALGGTTVTSTLHYFRGNILDYNRWSDAGNDGWSYSDLAPYFKRSENLQVPELIGASFYGTEGPQPLTAYDSNQPIVKQVRKAASVLGYPSRFQESKFGAVGYFRSLQTIADGVRAGAGKTFLGSIRDRDNLALALNAHVDRLEIDKNKRVTGLLVNIGDRIRSIKVRNEVILSAGALLTPKILQRSGIGPKKHLDALGIKVIQDLPVGDNLQDHFAFWGLYTRIPDELVVPSVESDEFFNFFIHRTGKLSQIGIGNLVGYVNTKDDSPFPNLELKHILVPQGSEELLRRKLKNLNFIEPVVERLCEINAEDHILIIVPQLVYPRSRGQVRLRSKNRDDPPVVVPNYLFHEQDLLTIRDGIRFVNRLIRTVPLKKYDLKIIDLKLENCKQFQFNTNNYWNCAIRNLGTAANHHCGTCKMGPKTDPGAVVNPQLRVKGIDNLRVIDTSIFPKIPSVNPIGPALMVGQKGAALILEEWTPK